MSIYDDEYIGFGITERKGRRRTRMISKGLFYATLALNASTTELPFSAISMIWPYLSRILTASFWLTKLSSLSKDIEGDVVGRRYGADSVRLEC
jgi:hypothetical protein